MIDNIIWAYWFTTYTLLNIGFNLSIKNTIMMAAFIHSTVTSAFSSIILYNYGIDFNRENLFAEVMITKFSYWYFVYDIIFLFLYDRDILFILHHLFAVIVLRILSNINNGLSFVMLILFLGEITNPIRLSKQMIYLYNKRTYKVLNIIFSWMFIIIRIPVMTYYYITFYDNLSKLNFIYRVLVNILIVLGLLGGYYWSYLLIKKKLKNILR